MPDTVCHKFLQTSTKHAERHAVTFKRGDRWIELNWASYREIVETVAAGLQTLGVRKGDRIAIPLFADEGAALVPMSDLRLLALARMLVEAIDNRERGF